MAKISIVNNGHTFDNKAHANTLVKDKVKGYMGVYRYRDKSWTTVAYSIPKGEISKDLEEIEELKYAGIYLLWGKKDGINKLYVGQADLGGSTGDNGLLRRLIDHADPVRNKNEKYKNEWSTALAFTAIKTGDVDTTGFENLKALESIMYSLIIEAIGKEYVLNGNEPQLGNAGNLDKYSETIRHITSYVEYCTGITLDTREEFKKSETKINETEDKVQTKKGEFSKEIDSIKDKLKEQRAYAFEKTKPAERMNASGKYTEIVTPSALVKTVVDSIPDKYINLNTIFFDPVCKRGEFLRAVCKRILDKEIKRQKLDPTVDIMKIGKIHNHIVNKQLFGFALSEEGCMSTKQTLYGDLNVKNIYKLPYLKEDLKEEDEFGFVDLLGLLSKAKDKKEHEFFKDSVQRVFNTVFKDFSLNGEDMRFDVMIGNPPYQNSSKTGSVYQYFLNLGVEMSDCMCMITRDNWMQAQEFEDTRRSLIQTGGIVEVKHYPIIGDAFPGVNVCASILLWEREYTGAGTYIRIMDNKVTQACPLIIEDSRIIYSYAQGLAGKVTATGNMWPDVYNTRYGAFRRKNDIASVSVTELDTEHNVKVIVDKEDPIYVPETVFGRATHDIQGYNVRCSHVIHEAFRGKPGNVLTNIIMTPPYVMTAETWALVATLDTQEEAINCEKYIKTRFVRYMVNQSVSGREELKAKAFRDVPVQDFTSNSDIDWSQTLPEIDTQLYRKYGLTQDEIDEIEETVRQYVTKSKKDEKMDKTARPKKGNSVDKNAMNAAYVRSLLNM